MTVGNYECMVLSQQVPQASGAYYIYITIHEASLTPQGMATVQYEHVEGGADARAQHVLPAP